MPSLYFDRLSTSDKLRTSLGMKRDEEVWADIVQARNTAVHVYRQEYAQALYRKLKRFYEAFKELQNACASL